MSEQIGGPDDSAGPRRTLTGGGHGGQGFPIVQELVVGNGGSNGEQQLLGRGDVESEGRKTTVSF